VSIANSIYQKFEKFRFSNFYIKIFVKKTKTKKTRNASVLSTENRKSFFLFFYTFSILSIFGALETSLELGSLKRKKSFLVWKKSFLVWKKSFLVWKKSLNFISFYV